MVIGAEYETAEGNQSFVLLFEGNGWQQRIGEVLNAYELEWNVVDIRNHR